MDTNARLDGFMVHPLDLFPTNKNLNDNANKISLNTANLDGFKVHPIDLFVSKETNQITNNNKGISNKNNNIASNIKVFNTQTNNNFPSNSKVFNTQTNNNIASNTTVFNTQTNNNIASNYKTFYSQTNNNLPSNSKVFNVQTNNNINVVQYSTITNTSNILNSYSNQKLKNMNLYEPQNKASTTIFDNYPRTVSPDKATFQINYHSNDKRMDNNRDISFISFPIIEQSTKFSYPDKIQNINNIKHIQQGPTIKKKLNIIKLPKATIQNITTNTYGNSTHQNNIINSREPYIKITNNQFHPILHPQSLQLQPQPLIQLQPKPNYQPQSLLQPQTQIQPPNPIPLPQPQLQLNKLQFQPQLQVQTIPQSQPQRINTTIIYKNFPISNHSNNFITQTQNSVNNKLIFNQIGISTGNLENINYAIPNQHYNIKNINTKIYPLNTPTKNINLKITKFPPTKIMNLDIDNRLTNNIFSSNIAQNININNQNNNKYSFLKRSLKSSPNLYKASPYSTASYEPETTPGEYKTRTNLFALKSYFNSPSLNIIPRNTTPIKGNNLQVGVSPIKTTIILPTNKALMAPKETAIIIPNIYASPKKSSIISISPIKSPISNYYSPTKSPLVPSHYSPTKSPLIPNYYSPIKSPTIPSNIKQVVNIKKIPINNNMVLPLSTFPLNTNSFGINSLTSLNRSISQGPNNLWNNIKKNGVFPIKQNIFIKIPPKQRNLSSSPIKYKIPHTY